MQNEEKLVIAKLMDKIKICKTRNKIVNTEFLTIYEKDVIQKELNKLKVKNYLFFGGYEGSEGQILVIYPEKFDKEIIDKNLCNIIKAINIKHPKELQRKYNHRDYLGCVMKTGLNRNRIGDIIVHKDEAYIIVLGENSLYIANFLKDIVKFSKSQIEVVDFKDIKIKEQEFEETKISVSSMRIDNVVSEIARLSRNKTTELLMQEKVFINSKLEMKASKVIKEGDIIAVRGKGKFLIGNIVGDNKNLTQHSNRRLQSGTTEPCCVRNKKGKVIVLVKKYK